MSPTGPVNRVRADGGPEGDVFVRGRVAPCDMWVCFASAMCPVRLYDAGFRAVNETRLSGGLTPAPAPSCLVLLAGSEDGRRGVFPAARASD